MGHGDDELGHKLMKAFIFAVTQQEELPATMLFYNGGAKLTVEGSPVLDDLKGLASRVSRFSPVVPASTTMALKTSLRWARSPTCT